MIRFGGHNIKGHVYRDTRNIYLCSCNNFTKELLEKVDFKLSLYVGVTYDLNLGSQDQILCVLLIT